MERWYHVICLDIESGCGCWGGGVLCQILTSCALITSVWGVLGKVTSLCSALHQTFFRANMSLWLVPTTWQWSQMRWILILEIIPKWWEKSQCFGTEVQKMTWGWREGSGIQMIWQSSYLQPEVRKSRPLGCTSATHEVEVKSRRGNNRQREETGPRHRERRVEKKCFWFFSGGVKCISQKERGKILYFPPPP